MFAPNNAAGLQLVPYIQPESVVNQKIPLTPEKLDNLYKMNYAVQPYSSIVNQNVYPYGMVRPVAPPIFHPGNSAPSGFAPNHPPNVVQNLQYPLESGVAANYNQSIASTSYKSTSNTSQQYFNQNVMNPQSALVHVPKV